VPVGLEWDAVRAREAGGRRNRWAFVSRKRAVSGEKVVQDWTGGGNGFRGVCGQQEKPGEEGLQFRAASSGCGVRRKKDGLALGLGEGDLIKYVLHYFDGGEIEGCDCCQCEVPTALFTKPMHLTSEYERTRTVSQPVRREDQFLYCEVCSPTMLSQYAHGYVNQHRENSDVLICMAQCTNMILKAIREANEHANSATV